MIYLQNSLIWVGRGGEGGVLSLYSFQLAYIGALVTHNFHVLSYKIILSGYPLNIIFSCQYLLIGNNIESLTHDINRIMWNLSWPRKALS